MSSQYRFNEPLDALLDHLDSALDAPGVHVGGRAAMSVALGLCEEVLDQCDEEQLQALSVSRSWLAGGDDAERKRWFGRFLEKINHFEPLPPLDRLILCALYADSQLDGFHAEFLTLLATDLGMEPHRIRQVFAKQVPELRGPDPTTSGE